MSSPPQESPEEALWTSDYVKVLAIMHLYFVGFFSLLTTLPLYVKEYPDWQIGLVVGSAGMAGMVARPLAGVWVDLHGRRPLLLLGAAATTLSLAAYIVTDAPFLLMPLRIVHGVAMALFTTAGLTLVTDVTPPSRRGQAMGYFSMVNNAAQVYAPWTGWAITQAWGFQPYFIVAASVTTASLLIGTTIGDRPLQSHPAGPPSFRMPVSRSALLPSLTFFSLTIAWGSMQAFLPLLAEERDLGSPGLFFFLYGLTMVLTRPLAGNLADRWGRGGVILPGLLVGGAAMLLLAGAHTPGVFLAVAPLFAVGFAASHTGLLAFTADRAGPAERGMAMATFTLAWDLGSATGSIALGPVANALGYGAVFALVGAGTWTGAAAFQRAGGAPAPVRR